MPTKVQSNQVVNEAALVVTNQGARAEGDELFAAIDKNLDSPFRMYGSNPYSAVLNISASEVELGDGSGRSAPPLNSVIASIVASTINFQTGATTGATFDSLAFPTTTIGNFRRLGLSLIGGGAIKAIWSAEAASLGATANPGTLLVKTGIPIGWIDLQATAATAFKTAGSASSIVENKVSGVSTIHIFGSGGSGGSGSGSGVLTPEAGYQAVVEDKFDVASADPLSYIRSETSASYDTTNTLYTMLCDKSKTLTTVGTAYTISAAPTFVMAAGDVLWDNAQAVWRRVASVTTTTTGVLNQAFPVDLTAAAGMVSQAIYSKDFPNAGDVTGLTGELPFGTLFGAVNHSTVLVSYRDSLAVSDAYGDDNLAARVAVSASNSGLLAAVGIPNEDTFSAIYERPIFPNALSDIALLDNATKERLFLVFFCSPNTVAVTARANLLGFKVNLYAEDTLLNGGVLQSSYCWTNSSGTPVGCTNPTVIADAVYAIPVSQVVLSWNYVPGIRPGNPEGDIDVYLEGAKIPRYYTGVTGLSYREISPTTIRLNADYSASVFSLHVQKRQGVIDTSPELLSRVHSFYDAVVGSAGEVVSGAATHTSVQTAHNDVAAGSTILVLSGTYTANVTISKKITIEGQGHGSVIDGTLTLDATSDFSSIKNLRFTDNISLAVGADGIFLRECWLATSKTLTDLGASNSILVIQE